MKEQTMLTRKIHAYDFAIIEIEMYLDTHPDDCKALALRQTYRQARQALVEEYQQRFGPYVVTTDDINDPHTWSWVDSPWPWEYKGDC